MSEDGQLLLAYAREGNVGSLSALVKRNAGWLKGFLRGLAPSDADAEDAFQDTWMRVIRSCGSYRGGSVRAYLATIARSVVIDRFRRNGSPSVSIDAERESGGAAVDALADGAPSPDVVFEKTVTAEDVRRAVRDLPSGQRDVVLMRIEGEMPFKEIAETLGIPLGTALTWMHAATDRLKRVFAKEG